MHPFANTCATVKSCQGPKQMSHPVLREDLRHASTNAAKVPTLIPSCAIPRCLECLGSIKAPLNVCSDGVVELQL